MRWSRDTIEGMRSWISPAAARSRRSRVPRTGSPAGSGSTRSSRPLPRARRRGERHLRARRADGVAHASARPDADRHRGAGLDPARGRAGRGDPTRRRRVVRAGGKALARRDRDQRHDAYRDTGAARRQGGRLAGAGGGRGLPAREVDRRERSRRPPWQRKLRPLPGFRRGSDLSVFRVRRPCAPYRDRRTADPRRRSPAPSLHPSPSRIRPPARRHRPLRPTP